MQSKQGTSVRGWRCRRGWHRFGTSVPLPPPGPGVEARWAACTRSGCTETRAWTQIAVGWRNERVCDDVYCFTDTDHAPHTAAQLDRIDRQRAIRAAWARQHTPA